MCIIAALSIGIRLECEEVRLQIMFSLLCLPAYQLQLIHLLLRLMELHQIRSHLHQNHIYQVR